MRLDRFGATRGRLTLRLLGSCIACAALAVGAATVLAATPSTDYTVESAVAPDPQVQSRVPERLSDARDLDGDGVNDIFASSYLLDVNGIKDTGGVYLFSGATRKLIYRLNPPDQQEGAHFGFYISVVGDVNGDGLDDLAVGAESLDVAGNENQGRLYVFDGPSGRLLYHIDNPHPQANARFGSRIGAAGDVTGDGRADIITGATSNDVPVGCGNAPAGEVPSGCHKDQGQAFVFDGTNGRFVRELNIPPADVPATCAASAGHVSPDVSCGNLGGSPQSVGDMNGDGVTEHMVAAYTLRTTPDRHGRIYVFDGRTGDTLTRIDQPVADRTAFFGLQDTDRFTPGDLNADGVAEVIGHGFQQDGPNGQRSAGRTWVFDGRASLREGRGVVLYELRDPNPAEGKAFGWAQSKTDYNKDGRTDLYLSNLSGHNAGDTAPAATYVFDGRDGTLLKRLALPASLSQEGQPSNTGTGLGWSSRAPGDLNGDGEPDYVAAAPFQDVNGILDVGVTFFFLSNVPAAVPAPQPPTPQPPAPQAPAPQAPAAAGKFPAKLALARARIIRSQRLLDVLAPITARASGRVNVELHAAGRKFRFTAPVNSADGRIRFSKRIPKAQADLGTGIITISYPGDADTRPQTVRLRAASQPAKLTVSRPTIVAGRVRASGKVTDEARGVVRVQLQYDYLGTTKTIRLRAQINDGRWALNKKLSETVRTGIAGRVGTVHSYTLFTGYYQRRIRGEMRSFQVLGPR
ncbi:MAG TPA: hypothetical protein VGR11_13365 [Solirubrobacteraceae bacterium]|nr:hypothetical protein [Solirubrobacteraceae bacterium]